MLTVPELPHGCGSWIITKNGAAVCEWFDRKKVEALASNAAPGVKIWTALGWLQHVNKLIKEK